jgi:hypothetical protein
MVIAATLAAGVAAATLAALGAVSHPLGVASATLVLLVVAAAALAELATVPGDVEDGEAAFALSTSVHIAAVLLLEPGWAAIAAGLGCAIGEIARREPLLRTIFNTAVMTASTFGAALLYTSVRGAHLAFRWDVAVHDLSRWMTYPAVLAALGGYVLLNVLPVSAIHAAMLGERFSPWRWCSGGVLVGYLMEAALGVVVAALAIEAPVVVPFALPPLVAVFLSLSRYRALKRETRETLRTLASAIDARDVYTAEHSERVGDLASRLAAAAGLSERSVATTRWAGRLHDLGKVVVDNAILHKDGPLDDDEWEVMRRHPELSADLIAPLSLMRDLVPIVRFHHERWDGRGYLSVPGHEVPVESYCITLADSYDAMTSDRPYRKGMDPEEALRRIEEAAGTQFHEGLARVFVSMMRGAPIPEVIRKPPITEQEDGDVLRRPERQRGTPADVLSASSS